MRRPRSPSPATVMSALALFISLSGVGYAAAKIGSSDIKNNTVQGKDIKNNTVAGKDIKNSSVASKDIKNNSVELTDFATSTLIGLQGPPNRNLRSGERIFGVYGLQGQGPNLWTGVSFPIPTATPVDSRHVVVSSDRVPGDGCTGSKSNPVSAPGFVCVYTNIAVGSNTRFGWGAHCTCANPAALGDGSRFGFLVQATGPPGVLHTSNGVWVYTAP